MIQAQNVVEALLLHWNAFIMNHGYEPDFIVISKYLWTRHKVELQTLYPDYLGVQARMTKRKKKHFTEYCGMPFVLLDGVPDDFMMLGVGVENWKGDYERPDQKTNAENEAVRAAASTRALRNYANETGAEGRTEGSEEPSQQDQNLGDSPGPEGEAGGGDSGEDKKGH